MAQGPGYRLISKEGKSTELAPDAQVTAGAPASGASYVLNTWLPPNVIRFEKALRGSETDTQASRQQAAKQAQEDLWKLLQTLPGHSARFSVIVADVVKGEGGSYLVIGTVPFDNPPFLTQAQQLQLDDINDRFQTIYDRQMRAANGNIPTAARQRHRDDAEAIKQRWETQVEKFMAPIRAAVPSQTLYIRTRSATVASLAVGSAFSGTGWVDHAAVFVHAGKVTTPIHKASDLTFGDAVANAFVSFELAITTP